MLHVLTMLHVSHVLTMLHVKNVLNVWHVLNVLTMSNVLNFKVSRSNVSKVYTTLFNPDTAPYS